MIGYCVPVNPRLASFRLRVAIPARFVGPHKIGGIGDVTFFFKNGNPDLARRLKTTVYDVVNAHFEDPDYRAMCDVASIVTCSSKVMAGIIKEKTGRDAVVIPDPYENAEAKAAVPEGRVLWFGHPANLESLKPYADIAPDLCTGDEWSPAGEARLLERASVVLLTGNNPGASENRPVKALRAGRFVVAPHDCPESWKELSEYIWIGDVREGIAWALNHREEACRKVASAQRHLQRFSPQSIGSQWADLFASTLGVDTNTKKAGSALISP